MKDKAFSYKLVFICILFLLMLSYPILSIPNKEGSFGGAGLFYYVFLVWGFFIALTAFLIQSSSSKKGEGNE